MAALSSHHERHLADSIGWLRAAVLGANDGIVGAGAPHGCNYLAADEAKSVQYAFSAI